MAAIGSVWASGTWLDTAWAADTWADASAPVVVVVPPAPHRLALTLVPTLLAFEDVGSTQLAYTSVTTALAFLGDDGYTMSTPLIFTVGETGPITVTCTGVDGTAENLATASAVTFTLQNVATGAVKANAVALTGGAADGTATWTRLSTQVDVAGDYVGQVKVTRSDTTIGYYPDGQVGQPITILKAVGT